MASISRDSRTDSLYLFFRLNGRAYKRTLKTADEREAERTRDRVEDTLSDVAKGRLVIPDGADVVHFVLTGGRQSEPPSPADRLTLDGLFDWYFGSLPPGAKGENTLATERTHRKHLTRVLGGRLACERLTKADIQRYISTRAGERYDGSQIRVETVRKELDTLRAVWNRAFKLGRVKQPLDFAGLDWPRKAEKPHFRTRGQIEATIRREGLTGDAAADLWDTLFLSSAEVEELLDHVQEHSPNRTFTALLMFLAHTGARKSEAIRSRVDDIRLDDGEVVIREKKRTRGQDTTRRVPLSTRLRGVLGDYLADHHPGGPITFCYRRDEPLGPNHLQKTWNRFFRLRKGGDPRWAVLRGFHVFRHSFASNLARAGKDQRVIDELMGHETEAMRRRYRHLFPDQTRNAISDVFG